MTQPQTSLAAKKTVAIIGGGFSGSVFGLKFAQANPDSRVLLIERGRRVGRGLAYGACAPSHLLNVPVSRMELGLEPGFVDWLSTRGDHLSEALAESDDDLVAAFVSRELFGTYLEERVREAISTNPERGLNVIRGEAVGLLDFPERGVRLSDGREIAADVVVLATGNLQPKPPGARDVWLYDTPFFVPDPWADDAFHGLAKDAPVVLLGTGLTMVDIALKLSEGGHTGPMHAVSRRGFLPLAHRAGGEWPVFIDPHLHISPLTLMRLLRGEAKKAEAKGVPWQRVVDSMRPAIPSVWHGWTDAERAQFLRHARPRWEIHRHRMAPRIAKRLEALMASRQLSIHGGRVLSYGRHRQHVDVRFRERNSGIELSYPAARVINCTGPRTDLDRLAIPIIADLRRSGLIMSDALGIGLETRDCAALDSSGHASSWLFALGPLTKPDWWEVIAVPEINAQAERLVQELSGTPRRDTSHAASLAEMFSDLGAGI